MRLASLLLAVLVLSLTGASAQARGRLICGQTQMNHFGIKDPKYKLARSWLSFPRSTARPGNVVFQWRNGRDSSGRRGGHVSRIAHVIDRCTAIVVDDKGKYTRNICSRGAVVVDPHGNRMFPHS